MTSTLTQFVPPILVMLLGIIAAIVASRLRNSSRPALQSTVAAQTHGVVPMITGPQKLVSGSIAASASRPHPRVLVVNTVDHYLN